MSKLLLTTPTDPKLLASVLSESSEVIKGITIISVDFPPIELFNGNQVSKTNQSVFNKKQDQAVMFDVAGLIVEIESEKANLNSLNNIRNASKTREENIRKVFVIGREIMFISQVGNKMISINGEFDVIPDQLISKVYTNFSSLKSVDLSELEDLLELSKDETAIKAFYKLGSYFTAKKYEINNNIFSLIEHQENSEKVAKKVLLKKMVAWEIRD